MDWLYCKKCGEKISENEKFCKQCGSKVNTFNLKNIFIGFLVLALVIFAFIGGSLMMNNDKAEKRSVSLNATAETNKNSSSSTSLLSETSSSSTLDSIESTKKATKTISSDSLYQNNVTNEKITGSFKILKKKELPPGFFEINKNNSLISMQGNISGIEMVGTLIDIDISIRNISNQSLMIDPTAFFIYQNAKNSNIYSEVDNTFNIALEPGHSITISEMFTNIPDSYLYDGWTIFYETTMYDLITAPGGDEGYIRVLHMKSPYADDEGSTTESQTRNATNSEINELNRFFLDTGGTQDQVEQITWVINPGKNGRFSADAMHSGVQKRIRTVGYDPSLGYMTKAEYLALTD